ncbi:MAG TPA: PQQ-dependent sugar dehydrogenase [Candidatus Eisenbacteria bacterium]|nr:PQQ-dependent sugar dehydrogenase [Candidatus Eisenbacteria bacterium]
MKWRAGFIASALALALGSHAFAGQVGPLPDIERGDIAVQLIPVATGMAAPDYAISPPGDVNRLFVLEQNGLIRIIQNGVLLPGSALDIQSRVAPPLNPANANDERGLLGLAFHPNYFIPGSIGFRTLYTYHSELIPVGTTVTYPAPNNAVQNYKNVVAEWKVSAGDPNVIDPLSRREIISFGKNAGNHNGGTVAFGPDGYLYLAIGDGGNANDVGPSHIEPGGNAQNLTTPLGKMLRFDPIDPALNPGSPDPVSANGQYRIPLSNPYDSLGQVPEAFAIGLRNPYRFAFDTANGQLILADVGQNNIEEIDLIEIGKNYGWAVKEGDFLFDRATGAIGVRSPGVPAGLTDPIAGPLDTLEYDHSDGISITGGFVYRGSAIPELFGKYVCGDLAIRNAPPRVDGRLFYADLTTGKILEFMIPQFPNHQLPNQVTVHGFGQDGSGELYALVTNTPANGTGGIVYKFDRVPPTATTLAMFESSVEVEGIRLRWAFQDPSEITSVSVERAGNVSGPWATIDTERRSVAGVEEALDRGVAPGTTYYYRLSATDRSGAVTSFATLSATTNRAFESLSLAHISPNPSAGPIEVEFGMPRADIASLRVLDLQGRVVATLTSGQREAGLHRLSWNPVTERGPIAAGLYFLELRSGGVVRTQRMVIAR